MHVIKAIRRSFPQYLLWGILPAILLFGFSLWALSGLGIDARAALRDPAQQSGASSLIGFLSHIGIWCWVSAAAIAFYLYSHTRGSKRGEMYLLMAVLSLALGADDLFMIHERFLGQKICYSFYVGCASLLLWRHYSRLLRRETAGLAFAGFFLAASIVIDLFQYSFPDDLSRIRLIAEDGFKFLGSFSWLYFIFHSERTSEPSN